MEHEEEERSRSALYLELFGDSFEVPGEKRSSDRVDTSERSNGERRKRRNRRVRRLAEVLDESGVECGSNGAPKQRMVGGGEAGRVIGGERRSDALGGGAHDIAPRATAMRAHMTYRR